MAIWDASSSPRCPRYARAIRSAAAARASIARVTRLTPRRSPSPRAHAAGLTAATFSFLPPLADLLEPILPLPPAAGFPAASRAGPLRALGRGSLLPGGPCWQAAPLAARRPPPERPSVSAGADAGAPHHTARAGRHARIQPASRRSRAGTPPPAGGYRLGVGSRELGKPWLNSLHRFARVKSSAPPRPSSSRPQLPALHRPQGLQRLEASTSKMDGATRYFCSLCARSAPRRNVTQGRNTGRQRRLCRLSRLPPADRNSHQACRVTADG